MPLYTVLTQVGALTDDARQKLASDLTALHVEMSGVPEDWVHIVFNDFDPGHGFSAGKPAPVVSLTLLIRTGRSADYKRTLLARLWHLLAAATLAPDDQIVIGIQEVPPSQAMEMGVIMPDIASEPDI